MSDLLTQQETVGQDQQLVATDEAQLDAALATSSAHGSTGSATPSPAPAPGQSGAGSSAASTAPSTKAAPTSSAPVAAGDAPARPVSGSVAPARPSGGGGPAAAGGHSAVGSHAGPGGSTASGGASPSAAQLASDQAQIDADQAAVTVARQALSQATVVSPIQGTVGALSVKPGQTVAAGGSGQIVVIGQGTDQVRISVDDVTVGAVQVGQVAQVTPSGAATPIAGTVTSVGLLDTAVAGSPAAYPVTVDLAATPQPLPDGQGAAVSIVTAQVADTVAVPSSAVHTDGTAHAVTVLSAGAPTTVPVQVGVVGPDLTQVVAGIAPGDQVVLADLTRPLPTATPTRPGGGTGLGTGTRRPG